MRSTILAAVLALFLAGGAAAQAPADRVVMRTSTASAAQAHSATELQAATEMLDAMDMEKSLARSIDATIEMQVANDRQMQPYEDVLRRFFTRYMSWAELRDEYADLYADHFTTQELREITAFYRSPAGHRLADTLPDLMAASAALGQKVVEAHMDELRAMIAAEARRQPGRAARP